MYMEIEIYIRIFRNDFHASQKKNTENRAKKNLKQKL